MSSMYVSKLNSFNKPEKTFNLKVQEAVFFKSEATPKSSSID